MRALLREERLHTVCESALCPNLGECFARHCATFMIMGAVCTRDCRFCAVGGGVPAALDPEEPRHVADAAARLNLSHIVVTSVTRDDLADGGAAHFAATIRAAREAVPGSSVEVLIPDFKGEESALHVVLAEQPDVVNHNVETVPRLYREVRPQADYGRSLDVLAACAASGSCVTKTGLMVGLGETRTEVREVLRNVADRGVDVVTIGQYLQPSSAHLPVREFVSPEVFSGYAQWGQETLGLIVESGPFVRSSFRAGESLARVRKRHGERLSAEGSGRKARTEGRAPETQGS
jgi:lipoic acid synthetase